MINGVEVARFEYVVSRANGALHCNWVGSFAS